jgi:hypothetical protein
MPEFILDDTGTVDGRDFADLDAFTRGYIEALFFTNQSSIPMVEFDSEESQERIREGQADGDLPNDSGFSDLHPSSLESIIADCARFQEVAAPLLSLAYELDDYSPEQAGRDFLYTRNGHGVGFWDRKELADSFTSSGQTYGDALSALCGWRTPFGEVNASFESDESSPTGYGFVHLF